MPHRFRATSWSIVRRQGRSTRSARSTIEPFATTRVAASGTGGFQYTLRFLPADDYTLAFTCRGNREDVAIDDDLDFSNVQNVTLDDAETLQRDID